MKRFWAMLILSAFILTACQPTPEKQIVIGPDDGLDEKLEKTVTDEQVFHEEQSEEFVWEETRKNVTVLGKATYTAPERTVFPVYRVQPMFFSEEAAQEKIERLWGTAYFQNGTHTQTKSDIQADIIKYEKAKSVWEEKLKNGDAEYTEAEIQNEINMNRMLIEQLEEEYKTAPETCAESEAIEKVRYSDDESMGATLSLDTEIDGIKEYIGICRGDDEHSANFTYVREVDALGEKGKKKDYQKCLENAENFLLEFGFEHPVLLGYELCYDRFGNECGYQFLYAEEREGIALPWIRNARPTDSLGTQFAFERDSESIMITTDEADVQVF